MTGKTAPNSNTKKRRAREQGIDKARDMNEAYDLALQNILNHALSRDAWLDWDSMKRPPRKISFKNEPDLQDYLPETPDDLDNMPLISKPLFDLQHEQGKASFLVAKAVYDARVKDWRKRVKRRNRNIERLKESFLSGRPRAVRSYFNRVLRVSEYPSSFPKQWRLAYMPESRHLTMDYELPGMDIMPEVKILRFSEKLHKTALSPRARRRCIQLSGSVIAQIALRTIHEIYQANRTDKVDLIRFKGYVKVTDLITNYDMPLPVARIDITRR